MSKSSIKRKIRSIQSKNKARFVVEFRSEEEKAVFLDIHARLNAENIRINGADFISASTFGAVCIVKEIRRLNAEFGRLREAEYAADKAAEENMIEETEVALDAVDATNETEVVSNDDDNGTVN